MMPNEEPSHRARGTTFECKLADISNDGWYQPYWKIPVELTGDEKLKTVGLRIYLCRKTRE